MSISIRQVHPVFVGEVAGIDIREPLSRNDIATIESDLDRYAVLIFRDQAITDEQQIAFTRNFGTIERAIDNSITHNAKNIWLDFKWAGPDSWCCITDDGRRFQSGSRRPHFSERRSPSPLRVGEPAVALRQLFSRCPCQILTIVGPDSSGKGREHGVR